LQKRKGYSHCSQNILDSFINHIFINTYMHNKRGLTANATAAWVVGGIIFTLAILQATGVIHLSLQKSASQSNHGGIAFNMHSNGQAKANKDSDFTINLPDAKSGVFYKYAFEATAKNPDGSEADAGNLKFSVSEELVGVPPTGITLSPDGVLSGTANKEGTYTFEICAEDLEGNGDCKDISLTVDPTPQPAAVGKQYKCPLTKRDTACDNSSSPRIDTVSIPAQCSCPSGMSPVGDSFTANGNQWHYCACWNING
jgi:hypothetical protein